MVWVDVFQFFLIITGMVTIVCRGFVSAGGLSKTFSRASEHGRLDPFKYFLYLIPNNNLKLILFISWNLDPFERYNTLNYIFGYCLADIVFYGATQATVQRYSSLPTFRDAVK